MSRLIYGTRVSLATAVLALTAIMLISIPLSTLAGYCGGRVDNVIMRVVNVLLAFPGLILALVIAGTLGPELLNVMLALSLVWWVGYARLIWGMFLGPGGGDRLRQEHPGAAGGAAGRTHGRKDFFAGEEITGRAGRKLRELRRHFQIVFQDSSSFLNPRRTVGAIIEEPLANFGVAKEDRRERVRELLTLVGLKPGDASKYPHEFSGGQRQRMGIARALALQPELVVCDEPVSSLDASIRAQILNLLRELKRRLNLSCLFISHGLAAVNYLADRVAVMYLGKIVEILPAEGLRSQACHPYTRALLQAVPEPALWQRTGQKPVVRGEPPEPASPLPGCRFYPRCPEARDVCRKEEPVLKGVGEGHLVACHLS